METTCNVFFTCFFKFLSYVVKRSGRRVLIRERDISYGQVANSPTSSPFMVQDGTSTRVATATVVVDAVNVIVVVLRHS